MDKYYLEEHWYDTRIGNFYKVFSDSGNLQYKGDSLHDYKIAEMTGNDKSGQSIIDFISAINFSTDIEEIANCTNVDAVLGYIAASSMLGCFRNAVGTGDQIYAFADFTKFEEGDEKIQQNYINLIPYDTSDAFGFSNCDQPLSYDEIINKDIFNPLCG